MSQIEHIIDALGKFECADQTVYSIDEVKQFGRDKEKIAFNASIADGSVTLVYDMDDEMKTMPFTDIEYRIYNYDNAESILHTVIDYSADDGLYEVYTADTEEHLFDAASLNNAWEQVKDLCERRGLEMGDCDYRTKGPDTWDDVSR